MNVRFTLRLLIFGLVALIVINSMTAVAAANTVPATNVEYQTVSIRINDQKPAACAGLFLTNLVTGSGVLTGTNGNDLILGSSGIDTINGLSGDDCILGGGGADVLIGEAGNDICLGGPDTDSFLTCEGQIQ